MTEKNLANSASGSGEWFGDASQSFTDIARMLIHLDSKGLVPSSMRKAIHQHAENSIQVLPLSIASTAAALASASVGFGLVRDDVAHTAYGMQSLAEQMTGWTELVECFGTEPETEKANASKTMEVSHG